MPGKPTFASPADAALSLVDQRGTLGSKLDCCFQQVRAADLLSTFGAGPPNKSPSDVGPAATGQASLGSCSALLAAELSS
jgi:hypothetical protein